MVDAVRLFGRPVHSSQYSPISCLSRSRLSTFPAAARPASVRTLAAVSPGRTRRAVSRWGALGRGTALRYPERTSPGCPSLRGVRVWPGSARKKCANDPYRMLTRLKRFLHPSSHSARYRNNYCGGVSGFFFRCVEYIRPGVVAGRLPPRCGCRPGGFRESRTGGAGSLSMPWRTRKNTVMAAGAAVGRAPPAVRRIAAPFGPAPAFACGPGLGGRAVDGIGRVLRYRRPGANDRRRTAGREF